jgi:hypothetical protein
MSEGFGIFDIIIILCGLYLLYSTVNMKKKGVVTNSALVGKGIDLSKAKDMPGYIKAMYGKSMVMSIVTILCGALSLGNDSFWDKGIIDLISTLVFVLVIIVYAVFAVNAQKVYLAPNDHIREKTGRK